MANPNYPSGQPGAGTYFQLANTLSPETFSDVARVGNIKGPTSSWGVADTTSGSAVPASGSPVFKTKIPTVLDGGQVSFDLFIKTDAGADRLLLSYFRGGTYLDARIRFPDQTANGGSKIDFNGFFSKFDLDMPIEGVSKASCVFETSGPIYWFE